MHTGARDLSRFRTKATDPDLSAISHHRSQFQRTKLLRGSAITVAGQLSGPNLDQLVLIIQIADHQA